MITITNGMVDKVAAAILRDLKQAAKERSEPFIRANDDGHVIIDGYFNVRRLALLAVTAVNEGTS